MYVYMYTYNVHYTYMYMYAAAGMHNIVVVFLYFLSAPYQPRSHFHVVSANESCTSTCLVVDSVHGHMVKVSRKSRPSGWLRATRQLVLKPTKISLSKELCMYIHMLWLFVSLVKHCVNV